MKYYFNKKYRYYGHLIRVLVANGKWPLLSLYLSLLKLFIGKAGSKYYIYQYLPKVIKKKVSPFDSSQCSSLYISPTIDYKFYNNFLHQFSYCASDYLYVISMSPAPPGKESEFELINLINVQFKLIIKNFILATIALLKLDFDTLLSIHSYYLNTSIDFLLKNFDFYEHSVYMSDPVSPYVCRLANIIKSSEGSIGICLNSPYLKPKEYLYYSKFIIYSRFSFNLFAKNNNIVKLLSTTFLKYPNQVNNQNDLSPFIPSKSILYLFISQPISIHYEKKNLLTKSLFFLQQNSILIYLIFRVIFESDQPIYFCYRMHPRDSRITLKYFLMKSCVFFFPNSFAISDKKVSLHNDYIINASRVYLYSSTMAIDLISKNPNLKIFTSSYKYYSYLNSIASDRSKLYLFSLKKLFDHSLN